MKSDKEILFNKHNGKILFYISRLLSKSPQFYAGNIYKNEIRVLAYYESNLLSKFYKRGFVPIKNDTGYIEVFKFIGLTKVCFVFTD